MNFATSEDDDSPSGWWGLLILMLIVFGVEIFSCVSFFRWAFGF
jgi:MYXO-CTERM domain-containing protein